MHRSTRIHEQARYSLSRRPATSPTRLGAFITNRRKQLDLTQAEEATLLARRASWQRAQDQLTDIDVWRTAIASNVDELSYHKKRMLMDVLGLQVQLWKADHEPRYTLQLNIEPHIVSDTTCRSDHNVTLHLRWDDRELGR